MRKPRRHVRTFKPRFAQLVQSGAKKQTVRQTPKVVPLPGDTLDAREWTGRPYNSPQRKLGEFPILQCSPITIDENGITTEFVHFHDPALAGMVGKAVSYSAGSADGFAIRDGFSTFGEMVNWFKSEYGEKCLPFKGIVTYWK